MDKLVEEKRGFFFDKHELEAKLRRALGDVDDLKAQV